MTYMCMITHSLTCGVVQSHVTPVDNCHCLPTLTRWLVTFSDVTLPLSLPTLTPSASWPTLQVSPRLPLTTR